MYVIHHHKWGGGYYWLAVICAYFRMFVAVKVYKLSERNIFE